MSGSPDDAASGATHADEPHAGGLGGKLIFTAGLAGLVAGAVSMALGEYISVSSQRDTEMALLAKEKQELQEDPESELAELAALYRAKGLTDETAETVARELTAHDALTAHLQIELNLDPDELTSPWQAAGASALSFVVGAILPLVAILLPPPEWRVPVTVAAVLLALGLAGVLSARIGDTSPRRAVLRVVVGGAAGLAITYLVGRLFGAAVA